MGCGVLTYALLPSRPIEANFLTREEKDWVIAELECEEERKRKKHQISATQAWPMGGYGI